MPDLLSKEQLFKKMKIKIKIKKQILKNIYFFKKYSAKDVIFELF